MSEWQPIETAPKDGRSILVCRRAFEAALVQWVVVEERAGWFVDPEWFTEEKHFREAFSDSTYEPTHWMPLPKPPGDGA